MDAITLLISHHDALEKLFAEYEAAESHSAQHRVFNRLADAIEAHATIEEKIFYPAVYVGQLEDLLKVAVEEHLSAKRLLADLLQLSPSAGTFYAKMLVLQEQIEHHVAEEEDGLFPTIRASMSRRELDALGTSMQLMFDELMKGSPRERVRSETDHAAPLG